MIETPYVVTQDMAFDLGITHTRIGFTGHRSCVTNENFLDWLAANFPGALWIHGGAKGFDSQVDDFAKERRITRKVIPPDYESYDAHEAPLVRNKLIVDESDWMVACYNGQRWGGTFFTVNYAKRQGKTIVYTEAIPLRHGSNRK